MKVILNLLYREGASHSLMGYTTKFEGVFRLNVPLTQAQKDFLEAFSKTRHMLRDGAITALLPDPIRAAVGLPAGDEGQYYVGDEERGEDVLDSNEPSQWQPGLWCSWAPTDDGTGIEWNGSEKFYNYIPWLQYIIMTFLAPAGHVLNGEVKWSGEYGDDVGIIAVKNNLIYTKKECP